MVGKEYSGKVRLYRPILVPTISPVIMVFFLLLKWGSEGKQLPKGEFILCF